MTCKDCLHYEACCYWLSKEKKHLNCDEGFICDNFAALSKWVHLPCMQKKHWRKRNERTK